MSSLRGNFANRPEEIQKYLCESDSDVTDDEDFELPTNIVVNDGSEYNSECESDENEDIIRNTYTWEWKNENNRVVEIPFIGHSGVNENIIQKLCNDGTVPKENDAFSEILGDDFFEMIVLETNRYAQVKLDTVDIQNRQKWFPTLTGKRESFTEFRLNFVEQILEHVTLPQYPSRGRPSLGPSPLRLQTKNWAHFVMKIPPTATKANPTKRCFVCAQKKDGGKYYGTFRGLILRSQLIVLLQNKIFNESEDIWDSSSVNIKLFRDQYPRFSTIEEVNITEEERASTIDMRPFMNQSPYTVQHATMTSLSIGSSVKFYLYFIRVNVAIVLQSASLPRVFRLFRALGLRHLTVVNDAHEVVGIVTRKDLARFHVWRHAGRMGVEQLVISDDS
uniref:CBS domain-containing protein n=1 Tax=Timema poppense TaxID=170557 RepID=A0A7R9CKS3_TIMPO|nr:unnamed protein product [Timema poppensis]